MHDVVKAGTVRVRVGGQDSGSGFVISGDGLIVTCVHVVGDPPPQDGKVQIIFPAIHEKSYEAQLTEFWLSGSQNHEDIAFLQLLGPLPDGMCPLPLGPSEGTYGHDVSSYGFPDGDTEKGLWGKAEIVGVEPHRLQLRSSEITVGFSGSALWDTKNQRVIGMVVSIANRDKWGRRYETAFAIPVEFLQTVYPLLLYSVKNPYRGLASFTENEQQFFFGRGDALDRLIGKLRHFSPRLLVILGPSGCGKSSLVHAGLVPALKKGAVPGSDLWQFIASRLTGDPFERLNQCGISTPSHNLIEGIEHWFSSHSGTKHLVLIFDQFEEVLATAATEVCRDFLARLAALVASSLPITCVLVVRNDFYSQLMSHPSLYDALDKSGEKIDVLHVLRERELHEIVGKPAEIVGLDFEEGLIDEIVKDTLNSAPENGEDTHYARCTILPLLEFTLDELWQRRQGRYLTREAYRNLQGVAGSLTQWANQALHELDEEKQQIGKRIFLDLVHVGDIEQSIPVSRRQRHLKDFCCKPDEQKIVAEVVQHFVQRRLLVAGHDEDSVEFIHETLLRDWGQLGRWIEENRTFLTWRQTLEQRMRAWIATNLENPAQRDKGRLLHAGELLEAEKMLGNHEGNVDPEVRKYIRISREQEERESQHVIQLSQDVEKQRQEAEMQRERVLVRRLAAQSELLSSQPSQKTELIEQSVLLAVEAMRRSPCPEAYQALAHGLSCLYPCILQLDDGTGEPERFFAHSGSILAMRFSPNGRYIVTVSRDEDRPACIWHAETGLPIATLAVRCQTLAISLDSTVLITGSDYGDVIFWAIDDGRQLAVVHTGSPIKSTALSPDGHNLAVANGSSTVTIINVTTRTVFAQLQHKDTTEKAHASLRNLLRMVMTPSMPSDSGNTIALHAVAFSADGKYLMTVGRGWGVKLWQTLDWTDTGICYLNRSIKKAILENNASKVILVCGDGKVRIWPLVGQDHGKIINLTQGGEQRVHDALLGPNDRFLAMVSGSQASIWDQQTGNTVPIAHDLMICDMAFNSDGSKLASVSRDGTTRLWDTRSGKQLASFSTIGGYPITKAAFNHDASLLATATEPGGVSIWETRSIPLLNVLRHTSEVTDVLFSQDGRYLATVADRHVLTVWEIFSGHQYLNVIEYGINAIAFSSDGQYLTAAYDKGIALTWDWKQAPQHPVPVLDLAPKAAMRHEKNIRAIAYSTDGHYVATGSDDEMAVIWSTKDDSFQHHATLLHDKPVIALSFESLGRHLFTVSNKCARLWNVSERSSWDCDFELNLEYQITNAVVSPNGQYVAIASFDGGGLLEIWKVKDKQRIAQRHSDSTIKSLTFNPDSHYLAAVSQREVFILDTAALGVEKNHQGITLSFDTEVHLARFSPDGKYLVVIIDSILEVWTVTTNQQIARIPHEKRINAISFSSDARYLAVACDDKTCSIWLWRPEDLLNVASDRLSRNLSLEEWDRYFEEELYRNICTLKPQIRNGRPYAWSQKFFDAVRKLGRVVAQKAKDSPDVCIECIEHTGITICYVTNDHDGKYEDEPWPCFVIEQSDQQRTWDNDVKDAADTLFKWGVQSIREREKISTTEYQELLRFLDEYLCSAD